MYVCSVCGYKSLRFMGRCPECGEWETMIEEDDKKLKKFEPLEISKLSDVRGYNKERLSTGISEVDRVLGGGILKGSVILLGGSPGVGKSTLFLQIAGKLRDQGYKVLLVSSEESVMQVKQRADRLNINQDIDITDEENLDKILQNLSKDYDVIFFDSIQALYTENLNSPAGSISQVRFCADKIFRFAKEKDVSVWISGHITKSGIIAGPKTLEHIVDVVLYLEGDKISSLRTLRCEKNRFGPVDEIAFLIMDEDGLKPINDPSYYFVSPSKIPKVGVAYTVITKGSLPVVIEVQTLVHPTFYPMPLRYSVGYDQKKLAIILALLEKKLGYRLARMDIYLNLSGNLKSDDPSMDMAVCASLISSIRNIPLDNSGVFIGEISLTGEFKKPLNFNILESEAKRVGFKRMYSPIQAEHLDWIKIEDISELAKFIGVGVSEA